MITVLKKVFSTTAVFRLLNRFCEGVLVTKTMGRTVQNQQQLLTATVIWTMSQLYGKVLLYLHTTRYQLIVQHLETAAAATQTHR